MSPITFPNLGIDINPSNVAFYLGDKGIYWYGIIIAAGFLLAGYYVCKRAPQFGLSEDTILDVLIWAVPISIICARIYYVVFYWELYANNPISALYIWEGGIAIYGAVIGAVIVVSIYCKLKKIQVGALLDIGGLGLLIGQFIGRWGNFMNREAYGAVTDSFFKMGLEDSLGNVTYYQPTFLYESVWNMVGFAILHFVSKKYRKFDGQIFAMYVAWYGLGRGFIEGMRSDSLYIGSTDIRVSQVLGFASCILATAYIIYMLKVKKPDPANMRVNLLKQQTEETAATKDVNQ